MIAPSHGVIWRRNPATIVAAYRDWANHRPQPKVLVIYDSMWESTAAMAQAILDGAAQPGVSASLISIRQSNLTHIAGEMLDAAAVAFGSATLNRGMMPMAAATLCYLEGLRPLGKAAVAFGSYGWGPGGPEAVDRPCGGSTGRFSASRCGPTTARRPKSSAECRQCRRNCWPTAPGPCLHPIGLLRYTHSIRLTSGGVRIEGTRVGIHRSEQPS